MLQLTHSPFLQALGFAIINSLWQFALLWLIYVLLNALLKLSSHQKYTAGLLLQFAGFGWFAVTFALYFRQHLQLAEILFPLQKTSLFDIAQSGEVTLREKYFAFILQVEKSFPYLSAAYLLILIFSGIKWMKAYNLTNILRTQGLHKIEVNWRLFVKQLSGQLDIKREVKIYLSALVKTPLTIGFFKPVILIPLASLNHLNPDQMEAVILHELAHIRRFDYLFNLLLALIEAILFFNPFMLLISRHVKRERENCCDDWVLQYNYNATSYAHALLQIAASQTSGYILALKATDNKQVLLHRIRRMIEKKETVFFNYRHQLIALLVVVTVLSSLAIISSRDRVNNTAISTLPQEVILQKMMFRSAPPVSFPVLNLASAPVPANQNRELQSEKVVKTDSNINTANEEAERRKTNSLGLRHAEINLTSSLNSNEQTEEDFNKNIETPDMKTSEDLPADAIPKRKQIALAEKDFQVAVDKFQENSVLFDQDKLRDEMKIALAQIKAAKIQLEVAQKAKSAQKADVNISSKNQVINILLPLISNGEKIKLRTAKLRLKILEAQKQNQFASVDLDCFDHYLNNTDALLNLSFINNIHSFSFGFSEQPKVKVPRSAPNVHSREKGSKIFFEEGRNTKQKPLVEPVPEEPLTPVISANKFIYTIKI